MIRNCTQSCLVIQPFKNAADLSIDFVVIVQERLVKWRRRVFEIFPKVMIEPIGSGKYEHDVLPGFSIPVMVQSLASHCHDSPQFVNESLLAFLNQ